MLCKSGREKKSGLIGPVRNPSMRSKQKTVDRAIFAIGRQDPLRTESRYRHYFVKSVGID